MGDDEIDPERLIHGGPDLSDLLDGLVGRAVQAAQDSKTAGIADGSDERSVREAASHASLNDRVFDPQG